MSKLTSTWFSERLGREINLVRWGELGQPVLFFPTAAGDAEECERFLLVDALGELLGEGRIKLYSVDSVPGMVWMKESNAMPQAAEVQQRFDAAIYHEVVPAIRQDCNDEAVEIIASGASIGAFQAVASLCRHPDVFSHAICLSGTYDLTKKILKGPANRSFAECSPLHFLREWPENPILERARERFVLLAHGTGRWEEPSESWRLAKLLGDRGIPNRVDEWEDRDHDWPLWRDQMPQFIRELVPLADDEA